MRINPIMRFAALAVVVPLVAFGQGSAQEKPLSAIDWLETAARAKPPATLRIEPDISENATVPAVTVAPLDQPGAQRIGLLPQAVSGLPDSVWSNSDANALRDQLGKMPTLTLPAAQALFFTLILAEAAPAAGQSDLFDLARIDAVMGAGALDPALALLQQAGPSRSRAFTRRYLHTALLTETEDAACTLIQEQPRLSPNYAYRVFCAARAGDWETAALLLGTARALQAITPAQTAALERFLDPELFEGEPPLPRPAKPDPLLFRIHEALGQPIGTRSWPLAYANADLRDVTGWKTQLNAAERLARAGALGDNRLLGIYTLRQRAASGGLWDRVEAVQRLETAIDTGSADAVAKTLPAAWAHMKSAGLSVPFATLFAQPLAEMELPEATADLARQVILASPYYESAKAGTAPRFDLAIAQGWHTPVPATSALERAIVAGFEANDVAITETTALAKNDELGRAILHSIAALQAGADGDMGQLSKGLASLRALGLEDVARRAALQLLQSEQRS